MIYLDHNATTPVHPRVFEAMVPYLTEGWGNPSSPYRFGREAKRAVEKARARIAECLECKPNEIVFTSSGTEADNLALRGAALALAQKGRHIITSSIEHPAVSSTCRALEAQGFRVTRLPVTSQGVVTTESLVESLTSETILVSLMHANNETGVIQPIEELADILQRRSILLHTDAVQTLGKIPCLPEKMKAALASFSGHKIEGPKGTGFLYMKEETPVLPVITGGAHERGLRAGTENVAGIVGLAEAVVMASSSDRTDDLSKKRDRLEQGILERLTGVVVNGSSAPRVSNTSNMSFDLVDGESILLGLELKGICASTGSACSTGDPEPSPVLMAMGLTPRQAQGSIRLSLGKKTQTSEIDETVDALVEIVTRLRAVSSA